ncbi:MAG: alpha/beta fold hydrolase [Actinomycetes bacterium]
METVQSVDGTTIAFDRSGHGPALVLVVGAFSDRSSTKSLAAGLGAQFTVYEYDRRGRGDSDEKGPYTIEREVEDLVALIDVAGGSALVFGHSSGGALALEAAARGVPVARLAVYEPPYTEGPTNEFAEQLARLVAAGQRAEAAERFLALVGTPPQALAQITAGPYWPHMLSFANTLPYEVMLSNDGSLPVDRLAQIKAPTLALTGGMSPDWASEGARSIAATIPGGEWRVLEGQSHGAADDVLIPVLTEFFTRRRPE